MLWNEFCKIWNWKSVLLLLLVGGTWFFQSVMGQMNLEYLPLYQTVQARVGAELVGEFGSSISKSDIVKLKSKLQQAEDRLEKKQQETAIQYKEELAALGFHEYRELESALEEMNEYSFKDIDDEYTGQSRDLNYDYYDQVDELNSEMSGLWEWEEEEVNYYHELLSYGSELINGAYSFDSVIFQANASKAALRRTEKIKARDYISFIPSSVTGNLHFVMMQFSRMVMILTVLMVVPYIALENRSGIYAITATTKTGRTILGKQIGAVLLSVVVLYGICLLAFIIAYNRIPPYGPFGDCMMNICWFDVTLKQFLGISLGIIFAGCIFMACLCVFVTSFCSTVIGMVVAALPCYGLGELLSIVYLSRLLLLDRDGVALIPILPYTAANDIIYIVFLLLLGAGLVMWLYQWRQKEDVVV